MPGTPSKKKSILQQAVLGPLASKYASNQQAIQSTTYIPKPKPVDTKGIKRVSKAEVQYRNAKKKPEPNAGLDNLVRTLIPLPKNAASLAMKKIAGRNRMNTNSIDEEEKGVMAKVALNAYKRTGQLYGGTEYEDYRGTTDSLGFAEIMNAKNGKINPLIGVSLAATDPAYRMATTTGRGTYAINPANKSDIVYTDGYDFKNSFTQDATTGKLKDNYMKTKTGNAAIDQYRSIRRSLAEDDQKLFDPEATRLKFTLNASDTMNMPLNKRFKNGKATPVGKILPSQKPKGTPVGVYESPIPSLFQASF